MIVNYTGETIIINTNDKYGIDYSNIINYLPTKDSIILKDGQQSDFEPKKNVFIVTNNCKYLGHFNMKLMNGLPEDPIIYVGIRKDEVIWLSNSNALPSDVDFGLSKIFDQSKLWLMFLNPLYYMLFFTAIFLLIIAIVTAIYILIKK